LPEPYQRAARLLGDAWRFAELAWLFDIYTQHGDDPQRFSELKRRHDELFAAPLPRPRRGRPRTRIAAWMTIPEAVVNFRWLYEKHRRELAAHRVKTPGRRADDTPAEVALASMAKTWDVSPRQLQRVLFSKAITRRLRDGS
jgi:hypothetical protein